MRTGGSSSGSSGSNGDKGLIACFVIVLVCVAVVHSWWNAERSFDWQKRVCSDVAASQPVVKEYQPSSHISTDRAHDDALQCDTSLVYFATKDAVVTKSASDVYFGVFGDTRSVALRRFTEHCTIADDDDEDRSSSHNEWQPLDDVTVPFRTETFFSGAVTFDGVRKRDNDSAFRISPQHVAGFLTTWKPVRLSAASLSRSEAPSPASERGFVRTTTGNQLHFTLREASSWWISRAFDDLKWRFSLSADCRAGDIRVTFQQLGWEEDVGFSVIGAVDSAADADGLADILPFVVNGDACHLGAEGTLLGLEEIIEKGRQNAAFMWLCLTRWCLGIVLTLALLGLVRVLRSR